MPAAPSTKPAPFSWRSLAWLAGLPALAALWAAATSVVAPVTSDSLNAAAGVVARESGNGEGNAEPWLRFETRGRDVIARGEAPDLERHDAALTRLAALPGLRRLIDGTGSVEAVSPFVWKATAIQDGVIELSGSRPTEIGAATLGSRLSALLPADAKLRDLARSARAGPPDFSAAAAYAVQHLKGLKPGAAVTLTDTVLSFDGEADSPEAYEAVRTAFASPPSGFTLGRVDILPPLVSDFHFVVERRPDGAALLSGNVVSEAARAEIRAAIAETTAGGVEDRMQAARGLAPGIDPSALGRFAIRLASLLREGSVRYEGAALSVSGLAIDAQAIGEAEAVLRDERPAGIGAGAISLTARPVSPYKLAIRREADSVVLTGHLPDPAARQALLAALRSRFFREVITDRTRTADGAPRGLVAAVTAAVGPLSTLASGEIAVSDTGFHLSGESLYPQSAERLTGALSKAMPAGWSADVALGTRDATERLDAATCSRLFTERVTSRPIHFAAGSTELTAAFYPVLDAVADLAKHCPSQRVEVVGHADPAGAAVQPAPPLPEYTSSLKETADKAKKPAKDAKAADPKAKESKAKDAAKAGAGKDAKAQAAKSEPKNPETKSEAKPEPKTVEPAPVPLPDLSQQRALAIIDYLRKAGVAPDRTVTVSGATPLPERRGIGLNLRS